MAQIGHRRRPVLDPDLPLASATTQREAAHPSEAAAKPRGGARVLSFVLQTFVMVVALVLFFLFAGVAAVVLFHLCIAGRAFRRRRRLTPVADYDAPYAISSGLSPAKLKGLPWFEYSCESAASPPWPPPDCSVCLERVKEGERCRALPPCGHVFHVDCVDRWLVRSSGCPICRARVGVATPELVIDRPVGCLILH
ncbi:RING-H2 finger protein ATL56-like [Canna indica]|uniref:RING-H2 finger protein ATL56-like n=1 Tax=Canna indica TaxID=4628 RepID=A0AAQ3QDT5_9LILI|nr:RING-H2 finger protein ATL56-like [Canna indica]